LAGLQDHFEIHTKIIMDHLISHTNNIFPRYLSKQSYFGYPSILQKYFGDRGLGIIKGLGNFEILKEK